MLGEVPKVTTLKGSEVSLPYVQCFLYLVSFSINVFVCHSMWLDTSWTGLAHTWLKGKDVGFTILRPA